MEAKNKLLALGIYCYPDNDVVADCVAPIKSLLTPRAKREMLMNMKLIKHISTLVM